MLRNWQFIYLLFLEMYCYGSLMMNLSIVEESFQNNSVYFNDWAYSYTDYKIKFKKLQFF